MLRHSFGDGSPSLGCCIGGESPPPVSSFPFFLFFCGLKAGVALYVRVGCVGVAAGWRGAGAREAGDQRSSACRGRRGGASGVCGCDCGVAKGGGAQGGGSAVVGSSRSEKGTEGRAVGEGVVWARAYGVSRHLPASKGRGCPGEPGSVTPLPFLSHTCLYPLLRAAPSSRLSPA